MTTKFEELNIQDIVFGPLLDSSYIPSQKISWITNNTNNSRLVIQSPDIITETYGIPQEGPFYATDKSRAFYKLPLCHERRRYKDELDYDVIESFYNKMKEIDDHCGTDEFKAKMFGDKNASKYEYQPIVRAFANDDDNGDDEKPDTEKPYRPPYLKLKIDLDFHTSRPTCKLYDKSKGDRELVKLDCFQDITKYMQFQTTHRIVIHVSRLYCMKNQGTSDKHKYGIALKLAAVECTNKAPRLRRTDSLAVDLFSD